MGDLCGISSLELLLYLQVQKLYLLLGVQSLPRHTRTKFRLDSAFGVGATSACTKTAGLLARYSQDHVEIITGHCIVNSVPSAAELLRRNST